MASVHLDLLRGLAALAVLIFHIRYRFFLDYSELDSPGLLSKLFYGVTSFGHDAVMAFFVLSGFLIVSSVVRASQEKEWSWRNYAIARSVRLYVVLLPALLLTWWWDSIGLTLAGEHSIYTGDPAAFVHDYFDVGARHSLPTLLGNLGFLQTIYVAPYGSNDPLWSLAYEFWYYALFPCLFLPLYVFSTWRARLYCLLAAVAICSLIDRTILLYFPIWLLGGVLALMPHTSFLSGKLLIMATLASVSLAVMLTTAGHLSVVKQSLGGSLVLADTMTGIGVALMLYVLLHHKRPAGSGMYVRTARGLAEFSFTLYLSHIPLLVFMRSQWGAASPWDVSLSSISAALAVMCLALAYAALIYWLTERHTQLVRRWVLARLPMVKTSRTTPRTSVAAATASPSSEFSN